ncbi:MAG: sugar phosphate isomerase/epimerase [Verrucomicrobiales bacterium]|nr:sugar phosphate isomerase/epimerase [Verrucomicrobiales bacterium]
MKIGFNMLLWAGHVTEEHFPVFEKLKAAGYDGVEIPIFDTSDPAHFSTIGQVAKDNGLDVCAVTICPTDEQSLISTEASHRQAGVDHLKTVVECAANAGVENICGPYYQELCNFTGTGPTEDEKAWAAEGHRQMADAAQDADIRLTIEALNRFECHFLNTMEQANAYVKQVNHPNFFTMYDTFHANIEEKDPLGVIEPNLDVIQHVHISANDRGTPGKDHTPITETIHIFKRNGYDNWMVIEAFGNALPDLAAATRVWRPLFESPEEVYTFGLKHIQDALASA